MASSTQVDASNCQTACTGNNLEMCGGASGAMNVYLSNNYAAPVPTVSPNYASWASQGCYSDDANSRALDNQYTDSNGMDVMACAEKASGYKYFGVEYGVECHYGNKLGINLHSAEQRL
jgi:hypothetical protein